MFDDGQDGWSKIENLPAAYPYHRTWRAGPNLNVAELNHLKPSHSFDPKKGEANCQLTVSNWSGVVISGHRPGGYKKLRCFRSHILF